MRASRIYTATNWRYAFGELLLIVAGILIALQASDWQNQRAERKAERAYLEELSTALSRDLERLTLGLDRYRQIETRVQELLLLLHSGEPYSEAMDAYFGAVYGVETFELNPAAYESLKSHGLTLISNRSLRAQIAQMYEQTYPSTERAISYEETLVLDLLRPYFLVHFRDLVFNTSATPIDYDTTSKDTEFLNLVDYRLQLVKQNQVPQFERSIKATGQLIEAIRKELGET
jgi:uncharacterized protein DUF6090